TGLHQTPEMIARAALDEDVDAVGISVMSGAHMTLVPKIIELLRKQGQNEVVIFGGGIIPDEDIPPLAALGCEKVFLPGASIGATAREIIFTSGATEANNLALFGAASTSSRKHLVTQATEHKAVLDPCRELATRGFSVTVLPVDRQGRVDPEAVAAALTPDTA